MASWRLGGIRHQVNHQRHLSPVERVLSWPFLITPRVVPCVPPACSSPSGCWWPRPPSPPPSTKGSITSTLRIFPVRSPATRDSLPCHPQFPADRGTTRAVATSTRPTGRVHSLLSRDPLGGGFCDGSSFCRGARTGDAFPRGRAPVFSRCPNGKNAA
jgi:hypothetical protein